MSIFLCIVVIALFIIEALQLIQAINRKNKSKMFLHILGVVSTLLVTVFTVSSAIGYEITSAPVVITTFVLATVFFIALSIDTLKVSIKK